MLTNLATSVSYQENALNAAAALIDSDVTLADPDSTNFDTGNVTVAYSVGGGPQDGLGVGTTASITRSGSSVVLNPGAITIGTIPGGGAGSGLAGESLIVTLNANATPTRVEALIEALTYQNFSNNPTLNRTISVTVNDGDGGTSTAQTTQITVNAENDAPTDPNESYGVQPNVGIIVNAANGLVIGATDPDTGDW